jgi:hypothetical protein
MGPELEQTLYAGAPTTSDAALTSAVPLTPGGEDWIIDNVILTNTTGTAATATLYLVPSGGTAGVGNALLYAYSVAANSCTSLAGAGRLGIVLEPGAVIWGLQGTSAALTIRVTGRIRTH